MNHPAAPPGFLFATGIENSCPTVDQGRLRVDEMEKCGHYAHWRTDFALTADLGIRFLRYGPPLHKTFLAPGRYDWAFADETFGELFRQDLIPIVDLCHFGVPDWIGNFQNPDFPLLFAAYAKAFAVRFPWVQLYTPVNEMYICARFSALYGWWNEQRSDDRSFVTALANIVRANVLAMQEIIRLRPDAIFIQSESSEYFHAENPAAIGPAELLNAKRFLSLDLNYGRRVDSEMYEYLMDNGMSREGMVQRHARAQRRRARGRFHLVLPDRPGRLGHRAARKQWPRERARPVRPGAQHPPGRTRVPEADRRLAGGLADAEHVPAGAHHRAQRTPRGLGLAQARAGAAHIRRIGRRAAEHAMKTTECLP